MLRRLDGERLRSLRRETAWVDPAVQLWNRSLLANLQYGNQDGDNSIGNTLEEADLFGILERLPEGMQTALGEGGGLVSGGEGQRVRLGRALNRKDVRLAILDEPFRGLDRAKRRALLVAARATGATRRCSASRTTSAKRRRSSACSSSKTAASWKTLRPRSWPRSPIRATARCWTPKMRSVAGYGRARRGGGCGSRRVS